MGGDAAAVEQSGLGEQERAGADRGDPAGPAGDAPHRGHELGVADAVVDALAPATTKVSTGPRTSASARAGISRIPLVVVTGAAVGATTSTV